MSIKSDRWIAKQCSIPRKATCEITYEGIDGITQKTHTHTGVPVKGSTANILQAIKEKRHICNKNFGIPFDRFDFVAGYHVKSVVITHLDGPMIEPFERDLVREVKGEKIVSYGTSSYGYDIRCAREFKVFTNINSTIIDPKSFDEKSFVSYEGDFCIIPPNSFALARTVEYFRIPRNVLAVCLGKSTYARCGIIVNVTPFEPEWEGYVTLEFSNTTPLPAMIYAGEGCAQVLFFESDEPCVTSYRDRDGKYQAQPPLPIPPKV